jgi:hypothetical protein
LKPSIDTLGRTPLIALDSVDVGSVDVDSDSGAGLFGKWLALGCHSLSDLRLRASPNVLISLSVPAKVLD